MKKLLLAGTALGGLAFAGPALAADLPVKAPPIVAPAVFSWTGCYIGGQVGGARGQKEWSSFSGALAEHIFGGSEIGVTSAITVLSSVVLTSGTVRETVTVKEPLLLFPSGTARTQTISSISDDSAGFLAGGQVGCDIQFAPRLVFGIEGEGAWSHITGTVDGVVFTGTSTPLLLGDGFAGFGVLGTTTVPEFVTGAFSAHTLTDAIASVTVRLGYTPWDRWLFYVKGGAAWAHDKYSLSGHICESNLFPGPRCQDNDVFDFHTTETRFGWTTGLGVEYAFFDGWSALLEYDFYDFGTRHVDFTDQIGQLSTGFGGADISQRINVVKFGINYRFGFFGKAPAPVVARY